MYPPLARHRQQSGVGFFSAGSVTVFTGDADDWTVTESFHLTNGSTNSGATLIWTQGNRRIYSMSCGGLFTRDFVFPRGFYGDDGQRKGDTIRLSLGGGTSKISYIWTGHRDPDSR